MKTLIISLMLFGLLNACYFDSNNTTKSNCVETVLSYNIETDNYVNDLLDTKPERIKVHDLRPTLNEVWVEIYYYDCKFGVKHFFPKPYERNKEGWDYGAVKRDGSVVMLDGGMLNSPEHRVSDNTLLRLQNICLNNLK